MIPSTCVMAAAMALLEDIRKGNALTAVAIGLGAVLLAPIAGQVLRPLAKAAIKGGIAAYYSLAELGETVGDIVAEAQHELLEQEPAVEVEARRQTTPPTRGKR